jgi:hypothetical protein
MPEHGIASDAFSFVSGHAFRRAAKLPIQFGFSRSLAVATISSKWPRIVPPPAPRLKPHLVADFYGAPEGAP